MNRDFVLNILFLLTVNLLIKPFFIFGIDRNVQNAVGLADYGAYFTLFNFTYLFQIIVDFGIQNFNNRNIAQHSQLLTKYFNHLALLKIMLSLLYAAVVLGTGVLLGYSWSYLSILCFLVLNQIFISFTFYFRSNISGLQEYFTDSVISVLDRVLLIIVCSILLWASPLQQRFQIQWFVYAQTFAYGTTCLIAFSQVYKHLKTIDLRFSKAFQWWILRESAPYALTIFLMSVYTRIDSVMIERMVGVDETGLYASAYRLLDAANMLGVLFAGLLLPMYARQIKEKTPVLALATFSFKAIWACSAAVAAGCFVFRTEIMAMLYTGATVYSGDLLAWLMLSFPAVCTMYIFGALLTANGSMRQMNWLFAFSVVFNIVCNWLLIPHFKALGSAYATLLTQAIVAITQIFIAKQLFSWKIDYFQIFNTILFAILSFFIFFEIKNHIFILENTSNWLFQFCLGAFSCILLSFLLKLIDIKKTLAVFKK